MQSLPMCLHTLCIMYGHPMIYVGLMYVGVRLYLTSGVKSTSVRRKKRMDRVAIVHRATIWYVHIAFLQSPGGPKSGSHIIVTWFFRWPLQLRNAFYPLLLLPYDYSEDLRSTGGVDTNINTAIFKEGLRIIAEEVREIRDRDLRRERLWTSSHGRARMGA